MPKKKNPFFTFVLEFQNQHKIQSREEAMQRADPIWRVSIIYFLKIFCIEINEMITINNLIYLFYLSLFLILIWIVCMSWGTIPKVLCHLKIKKLFWMVMVLFYFFKSTIFHYEENIKKKNSTIRVISALQKHSI